MDKKEAAELASSTVTNKDDVFVDASMAVPAGAHFADTTPNGQYATLGLDVPADEDAVYSQIAIELETNFIDKGLWIRLLADADGDEKRTKVLYIKKRAERLLAHKAAPAPTPHVQPNNKGNGKCMNCGSLNLQAGAYERGRSYRCNDCGCIMY